MEGTIMKRILPVIFMLITSITVFAQEDTRMLKEGRSWKVLEMFCDRPKYETYTVSGDTVINGKTWKKILKDYQRNDHKSSYTTAAYEEGGKLYGLLGDTPFLMLDFNKQKGDYLYEGVTYGPVVTDVDYITVNGVTRKRITFSDFGEDEYLCWVEGIGATMAIWSGESALTSHMQYFLECYDDGKLIFSYSDFGRPMSVDGVSQDATKSGEKYSINGMKLQNEPEKGIYIMNGKKFRK